MESDSTSYIKLKQLADSVSDPSAQVVQRLVAELRNLSAEDLLALRLSGAAPIGTETYRIRITPTDACLLDDNDEQDPTLVVSMPVRRSTTSRAEPSRRSRRTWSAPHAPRKRRALPRGHVAPPRLRYRPDGLPTPAGSDLLAGRRRRRADTRRPAVHAERNGCPCLRLRRRRICPEVAGGRRRRVSVTQAGLPCGEILGLLGIGVVVEAFDRESGQATVQNFATPA